LSSVYDSFSVARKTIKPLADYAANEKLLKFSFIV